MKEKPNQNGNVSRQDINKILEKYGINYRLTDKPAFLDIAKHIKLADEKREKRKIPTPNSILNPKILEVNVVANTEYTGLNIPQLTNLEKIIAQMYSSGKKNVEISRLLDLSEPRVFSIIKNIRNKLNIDKNLPREEQVKLILGNVIDEEPTI